MAILMSQLISDLQNVDRRAASQPSRSAFPDLGRALLFATHALHKPTTRVRWEAS